VKSIITLPTASMSSREAIVDHSEIVNNPLESPSGMSDTRVTCTIDLTAKGKQFGTLRVPRSVSQWSSLWVPIV
jgi:hypothetical protein